MTLPLLDFMRLFDDLSGPSWDGWRAVLARLRPEVREFFGVIGRGAGKSRMVALLACWYATRAYHRAPGEAIYVGVFAPDRKQARITFRYIVGLLRSVPELDALIVGETRESVELSTGVVIEVLTASVAAPRGRSYALAIIEEAAFLPTDTATDPDAEVIRAIRPALARVPGSLLAVISSPYARRGVLYDAWRKYHDQPDGDVVFVQAPTLALNPTFDRRAIERAYEDDPASAAAEYGGEFRSDVERFVTVEAVGAVTVPERLELPPMFGQSYTAFVDPSGGSRDSMTLAVAHLERRGGAEVRVLDLLREIVPPFNPEQVVGDFADVLTAYRVSQVEGDRYGGEWCRAPFRRLGIDYRPAEKTKSELYQAVLPLINSQAVELLDLARLTSQLVGLERRTARGGKDSIDHAPGGRDDVANAVAGALVGAGVSRATTGVMHLSWV